VGYDPSVGMASRTGIVGVVSHKMYRKWTDEEVEYLIREYNRTPLPDIASYLGRSVGAIKDKALKLGLKHLWPIDRIDKAMLYDLYWNKNLSVIQIAKQLGVGRTTVLRAMRKFGIQTRDISEATRIALQSEERRKKISEASKRNWEDEEYRSYILSSIFQRWNNLREDRWTEEEIEFLKENYNKMLYRDIAKILGRTVNSVRSKALKLGLTKREASEWSDEEIEYLKRNYHVKPLSEIIRKLQRSEKSIIHKAQRLGLSSPKEPNGRELQLQALIDKACPGEYIYTGDGKLMIGGLSPDFANCNGKKKLIELFGDYWHSDEVVKGVWKRTEFGRKATFSQFGYDTLVIWENELDTKSEEELINIIKEFNRR